MFKTVMFVSLLTAALIIESTVKDAYYYSSLWTKRYQYASRKNCQGGLFGEFRCCKGYVENPYNTSFCIPYCRSECPENSYCVRPDFCECVPYHFRANGKCLPLCPQDDAKCLAGFCLGVNCICSSSVRNGLYHCFPSCRFSCPSNQICVDKDSCGCPSGHKLDGGQCKPHCEKPCLNGACIAPNTCTCFRYASLADGVCQAKCWQGCENGKCVEPNKCLCDKGFLLKVPEFKCVPTCKGCELGTCLGPNNCSCESGLRYLHNKCQVNCSSCGLHGTCRLGGGCDCNWGYEYSTFHDKCCPKIYFADRRRLPKTSLCLDD